jgi:hypothetical protein
MHGTALRNRQDESRIAAAIKNPNRRDFADPLDPKLECNLGRLRARGKITEAEYLAGVRWREVYGEYLSAIGAPFPFCQSPAGYGLVSPATPFMPDEICENLTATYKAGIRILEAKGKRVRDAVNAICVYDEPEELGDFEYTLKAARIGLADLSRNF